MALEAGIPERDVAAWAGHTSTAQMPVYDRLRHVAGGDVARRVYDAIAAERRSEQERTRPRVEDKQ